MRELRWSPALRNAVGAVLVPAAAGHADAASRGKPVGNDRFYGANDPRRNTGPALGH
ncbi:hypothetical protein ACQ858_04950 [Variovorax ureilyticus]|uniref:hypothetical protein n=1 Tax=Variovorax ureilyticus TaxID=1836198 RepID=UPI003D67B71A